jgi:ssDNA-binding Zn-finger/Zn-ribbon topoisomerase 1
MAEKQAGTYSGRQCPACGRGLVWRKGRYSTFEGCSGFPACKGKIGAPRGRTAGVKSEAREVEEEAEIVEEAKPEKSEAQPEVTESEAMDPLAQAIADAARKHLKPELDALRAKIEGLEGFKPQHHVWKEGEKVKAEVTPKMHGVVKRMVALYEAGARNFLLVGPAGCGKSRAAFDFAQALKLGFWQAQCTESLPRSVFFGRVLQAGEKAGEFVGTGYTRAFAEGGVVLIDEMDSLDPNAALEHNGPLEGLLGLADGTVIQRHEACVVIATANTHGTGATRVYVGRHQLDGATLDRFTGRTLEVTYDRDVEAQVGTELACRLTWKVRDLAEKAGIRRTVSTRFLQGLDIRLRTEPTKDDALRAMLSGWTPEEMSKVGVAA